MDKVIVLGDLEHSERHRDFVYSRCIKVEEVKDVIRKMHMEEQPGQIKSPLNFGRARER